MNRIRLKSENGIVIQNNHDTIQHSKDKGNGIWMYGEGKLNRDGLSFSLQDAKWIVENLKKVIEEFEKEPVEVPFEIGDVIGLSYHEDAETYHRVVKGEEDGEIMITDFPSYEPDSDSMTPEDFVRYWNESGVKITHVLSHKSKA